MPPFSLAQSKSVPMKTRMHLKLERIMISKSEEEEQRHKRRGGDGGPMLRRSQSSPTLGSLSGATWTRGRGKGGRKLGVGGGLVKNPPDQMDFKEWARRVKISNQNTLRKRREEGNSVNKGVAGSQGQSPSLKENTRRTVGG